MDKLKIKKNGEFVQIPLSAFNNDENFITNATNSLLNYYLKNETYTKQEVNNLISQIHTTSFLVVEELPEVGESNIIYLLLKEQPNLSNIYDEYIYVEDNWELIGSTEIDLTDYVKNTDYAETSKGGVVKVGNYGFNTFPSGQLYAVIQSYSAYKNVPGNYVIAKNTLENVIAGKGLIADTNYVHTDNNFSNEYKEKLDYFSGNYSYLNIPRIEARSVMTSTGNTIRLFFKDITPEFLEYARENDDIQIHLFRYVKTQYRYFYNPETGDGRIKSNEKKWIHPANEVCFGTEAVGKQCWGVASIIPSLLAHGYSEDEYYDYIDSVDYNVYNGGVVESEISITKTDLLRGYLDINLNDLMSCLLVVKGRNVQHHSLDFIPFEGDGNEVKIIGCKHTNMCPVMKQPIKYRLAVPFTNSKGYTDYLYGDSNTIILECALTRLIGGRKLGYGQNRDNRILHDVGYGIRIKQ